jgi:hypothetical protein
MKAKSTFQGPNALSRPTVVPGSPHDCGSNLPMASPGRNISLGKPVIRWMSANMRGRVLLLSMHPNLRSST